MTNTRAPEASRQAAVRRYTARNALLRKQGYQNYGDYLRAPHWRELRAAYRASDLPQDCICGEMDGTQLHHITYERVCNERLSDLVPLCPSCHSLVHVLEWRGDGDLGVSGLTDTERAEEGRAWLAALVAKLRAEAEIREKAEREMVLGLSFAARLARARAVARLRHVDITHLVHLLVKVSKAGNADQMTNRLRVIEATAYGWEDWDPRLVIKRDKVRAQVSRLASPSPVHVPSQAADPREGAIGCQPLHLTRRV